MKILGIIGIAVLACLAGITVFHATVVYCNLIRSCYKDIPVIIGGIEASLRRLAHYDYWSDSLKRSILLDSQADLISYGMEGCREWKKKAERKQR